MSEGNLQQRLCIIQGCIKPRLARGFCGNHYRIWRLTGTKHKDCSFEGCERRVLNKGLCFTHYGQFRAGNPLTPIRTKVQVSYERLDELLSHLFQFRVINPLTECWEWKRSDHEKRNVTYGRTFVDGKLQYIHRIMATIYLGLRERPNMDVCHHCDNPRCFNPEHLFLGTAADNIADMRKKGRLRIRKGEEIWSARLTEKDVRLIRKLWKEEGLNFTQIGKKFDIDQSTASSICKRETWRHVT